MKNRWEQKYTVLFWSTKKSCSCYKVLRGDDEKWGSLNNGYIIRAIDLIAKLDQFVHEHLENNFKSSCYLPIHNHVWNTGGNNGDTCGRGNCESNTLFKHQIRLMWYIVVSK